MESETKTVFQALQDRYQAWSQRENPSNDPGHPHLELSALARETGLEHEAVDRAAFHLTLMGLAKQVGTDTYSLTDKGIAGIRGQEPAGDRPDLNQHLT